MKDFGRASPSSSRGEAVQRACATWEPAQSGLSGRQGTPKGTDGRVTRVAEGIYDRVLANGRRVFDIVYDVPRRSHLKRNQKWERGFSSLSRAKARRAAVVTDLRRGTYVAPTKVTLGEFMMGRFEARYDLGAIRGPHSTRHQTIVGPS